jgi:membrane fusion protein, multidrug efflux system
MAEPTAPTAADPPAGRAGRRRRGRAVAVAGTVAAVTAAGFAAVAAGAGFGGRGAGAGAAVRLPPTTAQVSRQTLVDTQDVDGDLGYGLASAAVNRLPGTLTWLPDAGAVLTRGHRLYTVDNRPVVLMYGALPAYRPLAPGAEGADVRQLEQNLRALGYTGFTVDDQYTSDTADAVRDWQDDLGLPTTGAVELGRVVFAAGPVRVDSLVAASGQPATPGPVLKYTGTARMVVADLDLADQRLAKRGAKVDVRLPDGRSVAGTVTRVDTVIEPGAGQNSDPVTKLEAVVALADQRAAPGLDQAAVKVAFTASRRANVLTVPVAALVALAEGGYGVQVVEGTASRYVPVRTGLFAAGRVEIAGAGITAGTLVGMPR